MTVVDHPVQTVTQVFEAWLDEFGAAVETHDAARVAQTFEEDGYWRDLLAFTWSFRTFGGHAEIEDAMAATIGAVEPRRFRAAADRTAPRTVRRSGRTMVEAYFDFDTAVGRGTGFVRLPLEGAGPARPRAWIVLTTLHELRGFEERVGANRPTGHEYSRTFGGPNWLDQRTSDRAYADRDPEVVIVGGGQAGLILGARLRQIGVDALILERNPRIGDNWRNRYHSLTLHNEVHSNHLPYIPFPRTFPTFLPKDKLADWLETYASAMELNTWTGTEFLGAEFDEAARRWTIRLNRGGDQVSTVDCTHLVLATGTVSGVPSRPELSGLAEFAGFGGEVLHSSEFSDGTGCRGKRVIVVGTGNSGHDIAQEAYGCGAAEVRMIQRGGTCVVSLDPCGLMVYSLYAEGQEPEDIDLITACIPYPVLKRTYEVLTEKTRKIDEQLLAGLEAAGFETDFEPDATGFHMKYLRRGGGYYINVGCSELIADGKIGILQMRDIDRFTATGVRMRDGSEHEADMVILATGYENQQALVRRLLGDEVAERVGPIWGFDDDGFMRNMWTRTSQPNFWIMGGALNEARLYSRPLALQLKADLEGLLPDSAT